ncbi:MAG: Helicase associated domain protein [Bacilli bacterium]|nr:Helicase associated domain protein [Bacilli bacterium]
MTKLNDEVIISTKEYIINTYKYLIENMHKMHPYEVANEAIELKEYIDVLSLKELKECYLWEKEYKNALQKEIDDSIYFLSYFNNVESENSNISKEDQEFYELFTRDIDFELAKKPILKQLSDARKQIESSNLSKEQRDNLENLILENKQSLDILYEEYRDYYRARPYNKWGLKAREKLHGTLISIMSNTYKFDLDVDRMDPYPPEFGNKRNILNSDYMQQKNVDVFVDVLHNGFAKPVIYAANHTNVHDVPVICKAIEDHVYIIAGDEVRNDINGLMFNLNGVDWVARADERSRFLAKEASARRTINDLHYLYLPEGTWNMTESDPMLPFNWGIIDIAQKSGHPIVPVVLEYTKDVCYVKIGKPMYVSIYDDKLEAINKLRDTMATMRWDIWERTSMDVFTKEQDNHKQLLEELKMNFIPEEKYLAWHQWLELLKKYQNKYNRVICSPGFKTKDGINFDDDGYDLGNWVNSQIKELSEENLSYTQQLRKSELLKLGLEFNKEKDEFTWDEMYEIAKEYKEKYGDLDVYKGFVRIKGGKHYPLGDWIHEQRWLLSRNGDLITKEEFRRDVLEASLIEYPKLDPEFESSVIFRPYTMNEDAFKHLDNLELNHQNAWLVSDKYSGLKEKEEELKRVKKKSKN